ncbi:hypothetical protein ACIRPU_03205 [Streptomyces sp. NPDC102259]
MTELLAVALITVPAVIAPGADFAVIGSVLAGLGVSQALAPSH